MAPGEKTRQIRRRNAEDIEKAVEAVKKKEMSIRKAAKEFNIPFETLRRHASGEAKSTTLGRPPKFDKEMELELRDTVKEMLNMGHGVGLEEVKELGMELCASTGMEPFKKDMPSRGWARGFMSRNNLTLNLKLPSVSPQTLNAARDIQNIEMAVRTVANRDLSSGKATGHNNILLETIGVHADEGFEKPIHSPEEVHDAGIRATGTEGVFYMGHVVGLEEGKVDATELCVVESEDTNKHGTDLCEVELEVMGELEADDNALSKNKLQMKKPRRQSRRRDAKEFERAVYAINYENLSIRQASKRFNLPFETLRRHLVGELRSTSLGRFQKRCVPVNDVMTECHGAVFEKINEPGKEPCEQDSLEPFRNELQSIGWDENFLNSNNLLLSEDNNDNPVSVESKIKAEIVDLEDLK